MTYWICQLVTRVVLALSPWRVQTYGFEDFPKTGPVLVVAKHASYLDPFVIGVVIGRLFWRKANFIAHAKFFKGPIKWLLGKFGTLPVAHLPFNGDPEERRKAVLQYASLIQQSRNILKNGGVLALFPEGHRIKGDELHTLEKGFAKIACDWPFSLPVVSIGLAFRWSKLLGFIPYAVITLKVSVMTLKPNTVRTAALTLIKDELENAQVSAVRLADWPRS